MNHVSFLEHACELAKTNISKGGGPFGAVIIFATYKQQENHSARTPRYACIFLLDTRIS
ncbi:hypothetical protein P6P90_09150 [Ectobacillus antri]|jgi:tRNA(Arg) A34 adenosine deaminase TadA|uniref:CMP/dCMP-type deaminase domain-containing protein n=1 Tax=Ectobacillus antri TaxID=2486280 RepID=A0ABT6H429_9BACI|nr:hypothetical protein [Ectobacillus antri]MDG4657037.1 hypothetical protein [Ectobacillus antri]MDG5754139.1 hypothetical protein [Ectobacillus antri]